MQFILEYWYLWIIGLILFPVIITLLQLKNIHAAIDDKGQNPEKIAKLFLSPGLLAVTIAAGIATFVCFAFFLAAIILGIVAAIKG